MAGDETPQKQGKITKASVKKALWFHRDEAKTLRGIAYDNVARNPRLSARPFGTFSRSKIR